MFPYFSICSHVFPCASHIFPMKLTTSPIFSHHSSTSVLRGAGSRGRNAPGPCQPHTLVLWTHPGSQTGLKPHKSTDFSTATWFFYVLKCTNHLIFFYDLQNHHGWYSKMNKKRWISGSQAMQVHVLIGPSGEPPGKLSRQKWVSFLLNNTSETGGSTCLKFKGCIIKIKTKRWGPKEWGIWYEKGCSLWLPLRLVHSWAILRNCYWWSSEQCSKPFYHSIVLVGSKRDSPFLDYCNPQYIG